MSWVTRRGIIMPPENARGIVRAAAVTSPCGARLHDHGGDLRILVAPWGLSGGDLVLVRESADDLFSADPVLGEVDLRWPGAGLRRWEVTRTRWCCSRPRMGFSARTTFPGRMRADTQKAPVTWGRGLRTTERAGAHSLQFGTYALWTAGVLAALAVRPVPSYVLRSARA